jgi:acetolactate synthase-1/3 small subunit
MTTQSTPIHRSGQSGTAPDQTRAHTLIITVAERIGSVDRVVGLLRRRRANMHTLVLGRAESPTEVRITVVVNDSEVGVEQLVEQMRKVVDVQNVTSATSEQAITREIALIKVNATNLHEIVEVGQMFGAHVADVADGNVTLEVTGSAEKIDRFIEKMQPYGIRDIARSGRVSMLRS